ncbi:MAG: hypothetical protein LUQ59_05550 [Methanothrix sp.]|nr:hypothetical protein [Methanothrix sp.]
MQRVSGISGQDMVDGDEGTNCMLSRLKELMCSKYGDVILLCSVTLAFGMLLMLSAAG